MCLGCFGLLWIGGLSESRRSQLEGVRVRSRLSQESQLEVDEAS
jgi:hypothetical protein